MEKGKSRIEAEAVRNGGYPVALHDRVDMH